MVLLSPESLTNEQFALLRDTPHWVVLAISASGGTRLDALLERAAGGRAIANGINNDHPLLRAIAMPAAMDAAMAVVEAGGSAASPTALAQFAADGVRKAVSVLRRSGGDLDLYAYREFLRGVMRQVAEAARENDVLGLGGQLVSDAERSVVQAIETELR